MEKSKVQSHFNPNDDTFSNLRLSSFTFVLSYVVFSSFSFLLLLRSTIRFTWLPLRYSLEGFLVYTYNFELEQKLRVFSMDLKSCQFLLTITHFAYNQSFEHNFISNNSIHTWSSLKIMWLHESEVISTWKIFYSTVASACLSLRKGVRNVIKSTNKICDSIKCNSIRETSWILNLYSLWRRSAKLEHE